MRTKSLQKIFSIYKTISTQKLSKVNQNYCIKNKKIKKKKCSTHIKLLKNSYFINTLSTHS